MDKEVCEYTFVGMKKAEIDAYIESLDKAVSYPSHMRARQGDTIPQQEQKEAMRKSFKAQRHAENVETAKAAAASRTTHGLTFEAKVKQKIDESSIPRQALNKLRALAASGTLTRVPVDKGTK